MVSTGAMQLGLVGAVIAAIPAGLLLWGAGVFEQDPTKPPSRLASVGARTNELVGALRSPLVGARVPKVLLQVPGLAVL